MIALAITLVGCTDPGGSLSGQGGQPPAPGAVSSAPSSATPAGGGEARKIVKAVYESCTVYTAATDFYFRTTDGQRIEFRNTNVAWEPKAVKVDVKLVDDSGQAEGPPGANPAWVGKEFLLIYNREGKIVEAAPAS